MSDTCTVVVIGGAAVLGGACDKPLENRQPTMERGPFDGKGDIMWNKHIFWWPLTKGMTYVLALGLAAVSFMPSPVALAAPATHDPRVMDALLQALQAPEEHVRWSAVAALTLVRDEAAVDPLSQVLLEDASADLRAGAAEALGEIASPHAIEALQQALGDEVTEVRQSAVEALGMIGGAQAIEALQSALGDADPAIQDMAAAVLQQLTSGGARD